MGEIIHLGKEILKIQMDSKAIDFIVEHSDLIRENTHESWENFYDRAQEVLFERPSVGNVAEILLSAEVDPAEKLINLPN